MGIRYASDLELRLAPFSIVFRGPHEVALAQRMYTIKHDKMGTLEGAFLVPIGMDKQGRYYELVFN